MPIVLMKQFIAIRDGPKHQLCRFFLHVGLVVCLNGSDDDEIHNNHLVISDKGSIRGFGRSGYLQNFILENVST